MRKGMLFAMMFSLSLVSSAFAQSYRFDSNPAYGPIPPNPLSVARLLSYENFRNIKLLHAAIVNFGGGEAEINRLVDQYAEASALYFQNRYKESAEAFIKNQIEILNTTKRLAARYKDDTVLLLTDSIKLNFKTKFNKSFTKIRLRDTSSDKYLENAQWGVAKANDYYDRFKDAKAVSSLELITSIFYFRAAKENLFNMMRVLEIDKAKKDEMLAKYKKDIEDNKNKVYESREKGK